MGKLSGKHLGTYQSLDYEITKIVYEISNIGLYFVVGGGSEKRIQIFFYYFANKIILSALSLSIRK